MNELTMNSLDDSINNASATVLNSFTEYCDWYLNFHDFSIFSEEEILLVLEEVKPNVYPCIPLVVNKLKDVIFIDVNLIHYLYNSIRK